MTVTLDITDPAVLTLLRDMERLHLVQVKDPPPGNRRAPAPEPGGYDRLP